MFFTSRALLLLCALLGLAFAGAARAQTADGAIKWNGGGAVPGYYPSAYEACKAQWQYYQGNKPRSRFIGAKPGDDWRTQGCQWTSFQYLCPEETGGGINNCGTILPSIVSAVCPSGYTPTVDGHCRSSPAVERPCYCDEDGRINPTIGNPIVLATGAKLLSALDFETADGDFRIGRRYRSFQVGRPIDGGILPRSTPRGLAGGWNLDIGYEIQLGTFSGSPSSPSAKVAVLAPDGTGFGFVLQANGQWIPDPAAGAANAPTHLKLEFVGTIPADLTTVDNAPSHWKLTDGEDNVWTLRTRVGPNGGAYHIGWPTQKVRRDGYAWTFAYNSDSSLASISDSFGRTAAFSWYKFFTTSLASPPAGTLPYPQAIASIALPDGTSLRYSYDPPPATAAPSTSIIKRLIKVERRSEASAVLDSVTYLYEDGRFPTHVTGIVDNRGVRIGKYAYDTLGRGTLTEGADGSNSNTVQYVPAGTSRARRVTNPLGKAATYTFAAFSGAGPVDYRLTQIAGEASANTPASTASIGYGSNTFVGSLGDAEARVTVTQRDSRGRPTTIVEGSGTAGERTTTIAWHPTLNVPATLARSGLTETRTYNSIGQLETVTLTDTTGHSVPYSTQGQARTYTYAWSPNGRLLSINGPLAADAQGQDDVTGFTYDAQGDLLTATDALGRVTTFAGHDGGGRPGTITDPNGIVTAYGYDGLGRVQTITVQHPGDPALNATTTMSYDAAGQVTGLTLPATETLAMDYDSAGRLVSVRASDGERWDYAYDAMGNVTLETVKRSNGSISRRIRRGFDELGRLIRQTTGVGHTARLAYDKVGNLVSSISPNGHATTAAFDSLDRVVSTVAPDSGTTGLAYDARDNLVGHTDPIAVTTQFVHNGFGEVIREVSPDRGTSTYWYDAAGELVQSSDGRGQVVDYARDYLGRLTGKVPQGRPASETVAYHWDSGGLPGSYQVGRLAKVVDGSGTTRFQYDHRGNLLAKEQTIGSGSAQLAFAYDPADRITHVTYPSGRIVRYGYDGKGRVNLVETRASASAGSWTLLASGHSYEPFGAVKAMTLGNGLAVASDWGNDGRLASRRLYRSSDGTSLSDLAYRYDADDNIGAIDDRVDAARSVRYGYDSVGRLSFAGMGPGLTAGAENYAYAAGTNRLASTTDSAGTRTIAYDGRGNTVSEARPGSVGVTADYDGYGRLIGYDRSGAAAQAYVYNGLDDRVTMAAPGAARHFVYDSGGRVLGEYGASASDVKAEFIWAVPQAGNDGGPFGGADDVGGYAPLAVATPDDVGAIQLNWVHGNHLGVPLVTTDAGGALATTPNDYLLPGFPGQSRVFADLYYNRYRDYDSTTGRYIQADPIGLAGGSNPYLYAEANPINLTDPTGEFVPILAGIAIGVGMEYFSNPCATWMDLAEAGAWGGLLGGTGGVAVKWFRYGKELRIHRVRIAPFGNRNPNWAKPHPTGRWPHYHIDKGTKPPFKPLDKRHRPWDTRPTDKSFLDRFW